MTFNAIGRRDVRPSLEAVGAERGLAGIILSKCLPRNGFPPPISETTSVSRRC